MKKILVALLCLQHIFLYGQGVNLEWAGAYRGVEVIQSNAVAVDNNENVFTTGTFKSTVDFDQGPGVYNMTSIGDQDIFIIKHDADGNFIWAKQFGFTTYATGKGFSIVTDDQGAIYITGQYTFTQDFDPGPAIYNLTTNGGVDCFVLKLDANGDFVWAKSIGSNGADVGYAIKSDNNGNVIVAGEFRRTVNFDQGVSDFTLSTENETIDVFVWKLTANGDFVWVKSFGGTGNENCNGLAVDNQGNALLIGTFTSTVDFDPNAGVSNLTVAATTGYVLKLNSDGEFVWVMKLTTSTENTNRSYPTSISLDNQGNPHVSGHFSGTINLDPNSSAGNYTFLNTGNIGNTDVFVAKYTANGSFIWGKHFGGTMRLLNGGIGVDNSGNVYSTGHFHGTIDFNPGSAVYDVTSVGGFDIYLSKLDVNGNFAAVARIGGSETDYVQGMTISSNENIYLTGYYIGTSDFDPREGTHYVTSIGAEIGRADGFIAKYSPICMVSATDSKVACGSYTWIDGNTYNASNNTATHTIIGGGANGCDSIVTLNLTINQPTSSSVNVSACGSYTWPLNNQTYTASGAYTHVIPNAHNCDSTITLNLTINQPTSSSVNASGCGSYTWSLNNQTYTASGVYTHVVPNANGCDSTITLNLTINQPTSSSVNASACGSYTWPLNNQTYTASGAYTHVVPNANNCDSTITLNLTINQPTSSSVNASACGSYTWPLNNQTYTASGAYTHVIPNAHNCDSTITLNLTINEPTSSSVNASACGSYTWPLNNQTYTASGAYTHVIPNAHNCDSTITLNLTINQPTSSSVNVSACGSYTWPLNNQTYTVSGAYTHVVPNANNCDSTITLNLTINQPTSSSVNVSGCGSYTWSLNNQTYTSSGAYTHVVPNAHNCDSTITLNLTINQPTSSSVNVSACGSYTWPLNNQTYTVSGAYTHVVPNANNCDSTITLNLTINQPTSSSVNVSACGSYTWPLNNQTYTVSGVYTHVVPNANGCDSTITLNLTINEPTSSSVNASACGSYTWPLNNQTYTASGAYTHVVPNAHNCDSTITLNLTINQSTSSSVNASACGSYTWSLNNQTYTASGAYTHLVPNAHNCDSTITLNLTINQPTSSSVNASACGSYTWPLNNQTYTASGAYTHVIPNAHNCDSTITLNLTINQPTSSSVNASACGSYTWPLNNQTYTVSGAYTHVVPNAHNCDSTITLNLTINQPTSSSVNASACGSYTWPLNNQTYTVSGAYTHVVPNANGCDSTITLNVTISNVDGTVSLNGITLTANQSGAVYQWIDCDNGNTPIPGATAQSLIVSANGNYAVQVTENGCSKTSDCVAVTTVGVGSLEAVSWNIYPNPNNGVFTITSSQDLSDIAIEIYSPTGELVYKTFQQGKEAAINLSEHPNGMYLVKVNNYLNYRVVIAK